MKKCLALLLAMILTVSVFGCAAEPKLQGSYRAEFDMTDVVVDALDGTENYESPDFPFSRYIPSFTVALIFRFNEDGTYRICVDTEALRASLDAVESAMSTMLDDMIRSTIETQGPALGIESNGPLNLDDTFLQLIRDTFNELNKDAINGVFDSLSAAYVLEGKYTAQDGKLYLSFDAAAEPLESSYITYEMGEDGSVTFTGIVGMDLFDLSFPYTLAKISE